MTDSSTGRSRRRGPRPVVLLAAGLILGSLVLPLNAGAMHLVRFAPSVGFARPGSASVTTEEKLTDAPSFEPKYLAIGAGATLTIDLNNTGKYNHTFTLSSVPNATINTSLSPAGLNDYFTNHTPQAGANVSLGPGGTATVVLTYTASEIGDSFEFVSLVPYQFQAGMWGFLNVTSNAPPLVLMENTTNSLQFQPNELVAMPALYPAAINVSVTNLGNVVHTFTVAPQSNVTVPYAFGSYFAQYPPLGNVTTNTNSTPVWVDLTVPAPGVYMYICTEAGHYADGMYGLLYVGVPPPPPPLAPSTGLVDTWVLAGSAALVGIGALLAVAAAFSGRFPRSPGKHGGHG